MSFTLSHTVTIAHPISVAFPILSDAQHFERLMTLSRERAQLQPSDTVRLPANGLAPLITHTKHPSNADNLPRPMSMDKFEGSESDGQVDSSKAEGRVVERIRFAVNGTVPFLFGLVNQSFQTAGAQVVDPDARIVLFESCIASSGIRLLKVRTFEEVELAEGKKGTKVKESVWGTCPWLLSLLLKFLAPKDHMHHMELFHTLFDKQDPSA